MTTADKLRALARFDEGGFLQYLVAQANETGEKPSLYDTARWENARLKAAILAAAEVVERCKELRIYCLGSDCSTKNMIERYDQALAKLNEVLK